MLSALIRSSECIGCTRCVAVCPVDAIVGAHKFLHTVLIDECIGCKLCIPACPVDCIDMVPLQQLLPDINIDKPARAVKAKSRHQARLLRLQKEAQAMLPVFQDPETKSNKIKADIAQALLRVQSKRDGQTNS